MLDYEFTMYNAEKIKEVAQRLKRMSDEIDIIVETGRPGWRGEAANEYYKSCMILKGKAAASAEKTKALSVIVRQIAEELAALPY